MGEFIHNIDGIPEDIASIGKYIENCGTSQTVPLTSGAGIWQSTSNY